MEKIIAFADSLGKAVVSSIVALIAVVALPLLGVYFMIRKRVTKGAVVEYDENSVDR